MAGQDTAGVGLCERYAVADVDSHIIEPADLWTSRVSSKWGDLVPHVRFHERRQEDYWYIGDQKLYGVGAFAQARWPEFPRRTRSGWPTPSRRRSTPRSASSTWTRSASTTR